MFEFGALNLLASQCVFKHCLTRGPFLLEPRASAPCRPPNIQGRPSSRRPFLPRNLFLWAPSLKSDLTQGLTSSQSPFMVPPIWRLPSCEDEVPSVDGGPFSESLLCGAPFFRVSTPHHATATANPRVTTPHHNTEVETAFYVTRNWTCLMLSQKWRKVSCHLRLDMMNAGTEAEKDFYDLHFDNLNVYSTYSRINMIICLICHDTYNSNFIRWSCQLL